MRLHWIGALAAVQTVLAGQEDKYKVDVACADDTSAKINIAYDQATKLLNFEAGTCNATQVRYEQDEKTHAITITVDMRECGMRSDGKVRSIVFEPTAAVTLGRKDGEVELVTYSSKIKLECGVQDDYEVTMDYGQINADYSGKDGFQGGEKKYTFEIASMDKNFTKAANISNRAGDQVFLAISSSDVPFEFYKFGVVKCTFNEMDGNKTVTSYDLFNSNGTSNCTNEFLDFSIGYNSDENRYQFSHTVFTFDPTRENTYTLSCAIKLCDFSITDSVAQCNAIEKACGIDSITQNCGDGETWENGKCNKDVDGSWSQWTAWSPCTQTCGGGTRERSRTCEGQKFGGKACVGEVEETDTCNEDACDGNVCAGHKVKADYDRKFTLSKGASCKDAYDASVVYANTNLASGVADWKANGPKRFKDFCNLLMMTFENTSTGPALTGMGGFFVPACATNCGNQNDIIDRYPMAADCVL